MKKLTWISLILVAVLVGWGTVPSGATTGLVAYYPFNGNANDESGNGNNATVSGAILTMDRNGNAKNAYSFDGKDDGIGANASQEFSATSLTLSAWIKISGAGDHSPRIVAVGPSGSAFQYYSLILENTASSRRLWFYTSESISNAYSSFYLTNDNTWHFVAVTYSAGSVSFYLNGSLSNTVSVSGSLQAFSNGVMQIGYSDNGLDRFDGALDEIRIYNRALSESEIQDLYNEEGPTLSVTTDGLTATVSWTSVAGAVGYYLYYCFTDSQGLPDYSTVASIDMGSATSISAQLPNLTLLYVAVQGYNNSGPGELSAIEILSVIDYGYAEVTYNDGSLLMGVNDPDGIGSVWFYGTMTASGPQVTGYTTDTGDGYCIVMLDNQERPSNIVLGSSNVTFSYNADGTFNYEYTDAGTTVHSGNNLPVEDRTDNLPSISYEDERGSSRKTNDIAPLLRAAGNRDTNGTQSEYDHLKKMRLGIIFGLAMIKMEDQNNFYMHDEKVDQILNLAMSNPELLNLTMMLLMNDMAAQRVKDKFPAAVETLQFFSDFNNIIKSAMTEICHEIIQEFRSCSLGKKVCGAYCILGGADCCDDGSGLYCPTDKSCCTSYMACCPTGMDCCPGGKTCSPSLAQCCGDGYCPAGYSCVDGMCYPPKNSDQEEKTSVNSSKINPSIIPALSKQYPASIRTSPSFSTSPLSRTNPFQSPP